MDITTNINQVLIWILSNSRVQYREDSNSSWHDLNLQEGYPENAEFRLAPSNKDYITANDTESAFNLWFGTTDFEKKNKYSKTDLKSAFTAGETRVLENPRLITEAYLKFKKDSY